jgi:hypothetical protein
MRAIIFFLLSVIAASSALADNNAKPRLDPKTGCPADRAFLKPKLHTVPEDGHLHDIQLKTIKMPISKVLEMLGGDDQAMAVAQATKQAIQAKFDNDEYMTQAERRFHLDTLLTTDALIAILKCRASRLRT